MRQVDGSVEAVVSIQVTGMEGAPWEGHRAVGLLAAEDTVLVPDSPEDLVDTGQWFEVLVIPTSGRPDAPVERLGIAGIEAIRRVDDGRVTTAVLKLTRWSRYPSMIAPFDGDELKRQVREYSGDVWQALAAVGAISPELREIPEEVLRSVPELEARWRSWHIRFHSYQLPGDDDWSICPFISWPCHPYSSK